MKNLSKFSTVLMAVYDSSDTRRSASFLRLRGFWPHVKKRNRMDNRRSRSKRDRRHLQCKCFCPDPYICSRLSFFLHCLCDTDCALLLAYPQKKIQSRCLDENCCFWLCIGGLHQACFVLGFHSAYTAGCTFSNCGFWRKIVFGSCCLFENKSPAI
jgi:hypothetical protein